MNREVYPQTFSVEYVIKDVIPEKKGGFGSKKKVKAGVYRQPIKHQTPEPRHVTDKVPESSIKISQKSNLIKRQSSKPSTSKDDINVKNPRATFAPSAFVVHIPTIPKRPQSANPSKRIDPHSRVHQEDPWNKSGVVEDRDQMTVEQDHKISQWRFDRPSVYDTYPAPCDPHLVLKDDKMRQPKKDKSGHGRTRTPAKTFTAIANNPFPQYPHLHQEEEQVKLLNRERWNVASNTFDVWEPKRFLPAQRGKSREEFRKDYQNKDTKRADFVETIRNVSSVKGLAVYS